MRTGGVWAAAVPRLAALAVLATAAGVAATGSMQQDFAAYYTAGAARNQGRDPYLNHLGDLSTGGPWDGLAVYRHSRFLYPPLVAELFRPWAALPYPAAKLLFTLASAAGLMVAAGQVARSSSRRPIAPRGATKPARGAVGFRR